MTIEEKLEYLKRAIQSGANIDVFFHNVKGEEEAIKVAVELSALSKKPYEYKTNGGTDWLKIYGDGNNISTTIFYEKGYMEEDINFDGGVEDVTA
jgi:hypothetical protein